MSAFSVYTYSPKDVSFIIGGYALTGWGSITISRNSQVYTQVKGIRGKNTRYRNTDTSATITVSILQTEDANDILSSIVDADYTFGTGRIAITIKDGSGKTLISSSEAFISGYPETTFSGGFEYRNWTILCNNTAQFTIGGNSSAQESVFKKVEGLAKGAVDKISGFLS